MKVEIKYCQKDLVANDLEQQIEIRAQQALEHINKKDYLGNNFLGWVDLPQTISEDLIEDINLCADRIRRKCEIFVVIGIGGSYLGSRMVIDSLKHNFDTLLPKCNRPIILYAGNTLSEDYIKDLLDILDKKEYCLCVISKSGTTLESAISFRILREHLEKKYGISNSKERIIAITDQSKGLLKEISIEQGYKTYTIPDNVGGRYSVLTPVGLLPIAVSGFDIKELISGARDMANKLLSDYDIKTNIAIKYAVARNILYNLGNKIELLVNYDPSLDSLAGWFKQLFAESEGKQNKGIFVSSVINTTDLHSMGQYIQQGERTLFETVISINSSKNHYPITKKTIDDDRLNYLTKYSLNDINHKAQEGTIQAHLEGGVSQIILSLDSITERTIGQLIYFFELSCAISGYILDINPFDQPGVENYKQKMFALLGKK